MAVRRFVAGALGVVLAAGLTVAVPQAARAAVVPVTAVPAELETVPVTHAGDAADDPTIWVDETDPSRSLVIGNDKGGAFESYDLSGALVQRITGGGSWGNSDVRQGISLAGQATDVVAAFHGGLSFYRVDRETRLLSAIDQAGVVTVAGEGLCLYRSAVTDDLYAFVITLGGTVRQYRATDGDGDGLISAELVRTFSVGSETEACVADDATGALYLAEEEVALWRYGAEPGDATARVAIDRVVAGGGRLAPDIEGLAIAYRPDGSGVLIASAQNVADRPDSYFAVYDLATGGYLRAFRVVDGAVADDCDGTDGIAAYAGPLGAAFPDGLFVCQDNNNDAPGSSGNQNFKYASLQVAMAPVAGVPPLADVDVDCDGLTCEFDGTGSTDQDGTVVDHAWDFGDGTASTEPVVTHTYAAAGTYAVRLTVTDDSGLVGSTVRSVQLAGAPGPVAFVGVQTSQANSSTATVGIPAGVQAGDTMLLFLSTNSSSPTAPSGWTSVATRSTSPLTTTLWRRQATAADAGTTVSIAQGSQVKFTLTLAAYRGLDPSAPVDPVASSALGSGTARTTPVVSSTTPGWLVSYWADRSSSTTSWTGPDSGTRRAAVFGTGGGRVTSLLADSAGTLAAGAMGGVTATSNQSSSRATTWSVVLRPAAGSGPVPPTVVLSAGCNALACNFDGSGSGDVDGQVVSYAWDFGDGATSDQAVTSHAYAGAGSYLVQLTVTDDDGLTASDTTFLQVSEGGDPPDPVPPVALMSVNCTALVCSVDGSTSHDDGEIVSYDWTFGDGGTASGLTAQHTFDVDGTYLIALTVTDDEALTTSTSQQVTVTTPPTAETGTPYTTGDNGFGQLGIGSTTDRSTYGGVSGLTGVVELHGGREHVVALTSAGRVWTWGSNQMGQLGLGGGGNRTVPTELSLTGIAAVSTGHYHSLAVGTDGRVWAWGYNSFGQLGDGSTTTRTSPVPVSGLTDVVSVAAGRDMSYAVRNDGTVWAWGSNGDGELGDGTTTNRTTPVRVGSLTGVTQVAGGRNHGLALRGDGTVWAWGWNAYSQLGDGTTTDRTSPVQVATGMQAVTAGAHHSYALRTDGQVMAWGRNYRNELGDGTTTTRRTPIAVPGATDVVAIGSGRDHGIAVRANGTLLAWGYNTNGQLGDGSTTNRSGVVTVPGVSGARLAAGGVGYSVVLVSTGPPPPNQEPTARLSVTCQGLTCTADGTASTDPDGQIASYSWTFGDGLGASGSLAAHTYASPGSYQVILTVTDPGGLTSTATQWVTVDTPPPGGTVTFIGATSLNANTSAPNGTVPSGVQAGDGLVAIISLARVVSLQPPAGWTQVGESSTASILTRVYRRTAVAGDAGSAVVFTAGSLVKTSLQVVAYRGVGSGGFVTAAFQPTSASGTTRSAPAAVVSTPGSWVANYWVDRSSTSHTWAAPAGLTARSTSYGSGGGQVNALLADSGGPVATGTYAARTATASASSNQAIGATLVLTP